jgi:spore coat polysaccharide biosynthesis protein SpsF
MLQLQLERLARLDIGPIVVATSTLAQDDPIVAVANSTGVPVVRGSEADVLDRFATAARAYPAEHVVRLTADCPLIDPVLVRQVFDHHTAHGFDYTSTTLLRTFPDGLDVEVMRHDALTTAAASATRRDEREHVTPYLQRNPHTFRLGSFVGEQDLEDERWTVDTREDLDWIESSLRRIADPVGASWLQVLAQFGRQEPQQNVRYQLHVSRGRRATNQTAATSRDFCGRDVLDPSHRTWAVFDSGLQVGTIGVDVRRGGIGTIRADVERSVDSRALLAALDKRLRADLQVVELVGPADWAAPLVAAGFRHHADGSFRRIRLHDDEAPRTSHVTIGQ